jgi:hypothetical protein
MDGQRHAHCGSGQQIRLKGSHWRSPLPQGYAMDRVEAIQLKP